MPDFTLIRSLMTPFRILKIFLQHSVNKTCDKELESANKSIV